MTIYAVAAYADILTVGTDVLCIELFKTETATEAESEMRNYIMCNLVNQGVNPDNIYIRHPLATFKVTEDDNLLDFEWIETEKFVEPQYRGQTHE